MRLGISPELFFSPPLPPQVSNNLQALSSGSELAAAVGAEVSFWGWGGGVLVEVGGGGWWRLVGGGGGWWAGGGEVGGWGLVGGVGGGWGLVGVGGWWGGRDAEGCGKPCNAQMVTCPSFFNSFPWNIWGMPSCMSEVLVASYSKSVRTQ